MNANIEKALAAANDTRALWIGAGVSDRVADLFKEQFPSMPAVIVADTTTWQVLGEKGKSAVLCCRNHTGISLYF